MTGNDVAQIVVFLLVVTAFTPLLGAYLYRVIERKPIPGVSRVLGPVERGAYRLLRIDPDREQGWKAYAGAVIAFSAASFAVLYVILRLQGHLPLNPADYPGMSWDVAFNTAISFVTNTNWQFYAGEASLSYLSQMAGLAVQNFASAAVGIAVMAAVVRGFARRGTDNLGNFWSDLVRITLYALVPLAVVVGIVLGSQGVMQTFDDPVTYQTLEGRTLGVTGADGAPVTQTLYRGPVASQIAIKQVGTNGGGYDNANSAAPVENPSAVTNYAGAVGRARDRVRAHLHLRADGGLAPPGVGDLRGDDVDARRGDRGDGAVREPRRVRGAPVDRRRAAAGRRPGRRQHERQGGPLRRRRTRRCGPRSPPAPRPGRSTAATTR